MPADAGDFRRATYSLMTAVAVAIAAARVVGAESVPEPSRYTPPAKDGYGVVVPDPPRPWPAARPDPTPMFSSNDKSRWATVRALVDTGTYAIGRRKYADGGDPKAYRDEGIVTEGQYKSLDIVLRPLDPGDAGKPVAKEFYSSKPPLLSTLVAAEYWVLKQFHGWSIVADRWLVIPLILVTVNVVPFAVYLVLMGRLIETTGKTDFGRLLAFTTACFGTYLTTFAGTLNNHLPAAYCVLFAAYPLLTAVAEGRDMTPAGYAGCGFFAALAAAFDLPAASYLAGIGAPLLVGRPRPAVFYFVPAAAVPVAGLLACNYLALGTVIPAYSEFGGPWYNFDGSHWAKHGTPLARGIDFANEAKDIYALHLLVGHHGWFSLTPVWLLAAFGLLAVGVGSASDIEKVVGTKKGTPWTPALFAAMTIVVSVVVIGFYIHKTNNYGGFTSGPRWLFWLTPLWLLAVPVGADRLAGSRGGRVVAAVLLGFSVLSVFYPAWNPWRAPWLLQLMEFKGWVRY